MNFNLNFLFIKDSWTIFNITNVPRTQSQHIEIISKVSRDTEDWSNNAGNSASPQQEYITF